MHFFCILLLFVPYVCVEADDGVKADGDVTADSVDKAEVGIVMGFSKDVSAPVEGVSVDTSDLRNKKPEDLEEFLECSYHYKIETITETKKTNEKEGRKVTEHTISKSQYAFFLQCVTLKSQDSYVFIFFNSLPIEKLPVTSCNKYDVQKSIFPPMPEYVLQTRYGSILNTFYTIRDDPKEEKIPALSLYLLYKNVRGDCYQRLYQVALPDKRYRFELKDRQKETLVDRSFSRDKRCGEVEFNCQAPSKELKNVVLAVTDPKCRSLYTPLDLAPIGEPGTSKQLECTVQHPYNVKSDYYYKLICVKAPISSERQGEEFLAFVAYGRVTETNATPLERFTVKSCNEDDIVNSIFPGRIYNREGEPDPWALFPRLSFKHANGKCYTHEYYTHDGKVHNAKLLEETTCSRNMFQLVNPGYKSSMMWTSCIGPTSAAGEPKTLSLTPAF